jgi:hypothetical protein
MTADRPKQGRKVGSIPLMLWKMVEILQGFSGMGSQRGKWPGAPIEPDTLSLYRFALEAGLARERNRNTAGSFVQGKAGFRNITKVNWQSTSGSPLSFLPCRVPLNLPCLLSHPKFLSFLN